MSVLTPSTSVKTDKIGATHSDNQKTAENHKTAAKHHGEAAKHHLEAAKHHEDGNHEKAAHSTVIAHGHSSLANEAQHNDAKSHALEN